MSEYKVSGTLVSGAFFSVVVVARNGWDAMAKARKATPETIKAMSNYKVTA